MWDDYEGNGKIQLANWQMVSMKKSTGCLRRPCLPKLKNLNIALLESWVKKFIIDEGKLWHNIIKNKYVRNALNIFYLPHSQPSTFWKGAMFAAKALKFGYRWRVGDGTKIRFWGHMVWDCTSCSAILGGFFVCNQIGVRLS
jgi:hypothetical protein